MPDMKLPARAGRLHDLYDRARHMPPVQLALALSAVIGTAGIATLAAGAIPGSPDGPAAMARGAAAALLFIGMYVLFNRTVEDRAPIELGLAGWAGEAGFGLLAGLALFSAVVGVIWAGGGYAVVGTRPANVLFAVIGISILSGVVEEIALRGLFFRLVEGWLGSWAALILSALLFGALHLGNDNATLLAGAAIALEAGVMLAALFMVTRRLWAVIGLHAAWNFAQGGIFGIAVSGNSVKGLLVPRISGPEWLTGGAFGAEASLPAVVICTGFGAAMLVLAARRGRFMPPVWVRRRQGAGAGLQA